MYHETGQAHSSASLVYFEDGASIHHVNAGSRVSKMGAYPIIISIVLCRTDVALCVHMGTGSTAAAGAAAHSRAWPPRYIKPDARDSGRQLSIRMGVRRASRTRHSQCMDRLPYALATEPRGCGPDPPIGVP